MTRKISVYRYKNFWLKGGRISHWDLNDIELECNCQTAVNLLLQRIEIFGGKQLSELLCHTKLDGCWFKPCYVLGPTLVLILAMRLQVSTNTMLNIGEWAFTAYSWPWRTKWLLRKYFLFSKKTKWWLTKPSLTLVFSCLGKYLKVCPKGLQPFPESLYLSIIFTILHSLHIKTQHQMLQYVMYLQEISLIF